MAERFGVVYFADTSSFCGQSAHHQLPGFLTPLACLEQRLLGHVGCAAARMHAPIRAQYYGFTMVLLWFYYVLLAFTALNHGTQDSQAPGQASGQPGGAPIPWPSRHPWRNPAAPGAQFGW